MLKKLQLKWNLKNLQMKRSLQKQKMEENFEWPHKVAEEGCPKWGREDHLEIESGEGSPKKELEEDSPTKESKVNGLDEHPKRSDSKMILKRLTLQRSLQKRTTPNKESEEEDQKENLKKTASEKLLEDGSEKAIEEKNSLLWLALTRSLMEKKSWKREENDWKKNQNLKMTALNAFDEEGSESVWQRTRWKGGGEDTYKKFLIVSLMKIRQSSPPHVVQWLSFSSGIKISLVVGLARGSWSMIFFSHWCFSLSLSLFLCEKSIIHIKKKDMAYNGHHDFQAGYICFVRLWEVFQNVWDPTAMGGCTVPCTI